MKTLLEVVGRLKPAFNHAFLLFFLFQDENNGVVEQAQESRNCCSSLRACACGRHAGVLLGVLQGILFAISQVVVKQITEQPTLVDSLSTEESLLQILCLRSAIEVAVAFVIIAVLHRRLEHQLGAPGERLYVLTNGFFYACVQGFIYMSLSTISPITASVILKSNVSTVVLAWIILGERLTAIDVILVLVALSGLLTLLLGSQEPQVTNPSSQRYIYGLCFAVLASLALSACFVANRRILRTNPITVSVVQSACTVLGAVAVVYACAGGFIYPFTLLKMGVIGLLAAAVLGGHLCQVRALQIENAAIVSVATTSEIPAVFMFQSAITSTFPPVAVIVGSVIIVVTLIAAPLRRKLQETLDEWVSMLSSCCCRRTLDYQSL